MTLNAIAIIISSKILPITYAVIGFGILITVHELGHFCFCKLFKIHTPSFSIGFGPTLIQRQIGQTKFKLSALPLGGYVEIAGSSEIGQGEQKHANMTGEKSFTQKPYWQKVLVQLGGILFNLIFAYLVFSILFLVGIPKKKAYLAITKQQKSVLEELKLQSNDKIISIENKSLSENPKVLLQEIHTILIEPMTKNELQKVTLEILRKKIPSKDASIESEQFTKIPITVPVATKEQQDKLLGIFEIKTTPLKGQYEKYPFFSAIWQGIKTTNNWIYQICYSLKYLITKRSLKGAGGPIMIVSKAFEAAQQGIVSLLLFWAFISINLAIINLLPLPVLDGGQVLFTTIEAIIRRQIPEMVRTIFGLISWGLLLWLILYLSYKDILRIILRK
jgi:regulator of sigma E protease